MRFKNKKWLLTTVTFILFQSFINLCEVQLLLEGFRSRFHRRKSLPSDGLQLNPSCVWRSLEGEWEPDWEWRGTFRRLWCASEMLQRSTSLPVFRIASFCNWNTVWLFLCVFSSFLMVSELVFSYLFLYVLVFKYFKLNVIRYSDMFVISRCY